MRISCSLNAFLGYLYYSSRCVYSIITTAHVKIKKVASLLKYHIGACVNHLPHWLLQIFTFSNFTQVCKIYNTSYRQHRHVKMRFIIHILINPRYINTFKISQSYLNGTCAFYTFAFQCYLIFSSEKPSKNSKRLFLSFSFSDDSVEQEIRLSLSF